MTRPVSDQQELVLVYGLVGCGLGLGIDLGLASLVLVLVGLAAV